LLVAKNNAGGIILELAGADKAAARAALVSAGNGVFLSVCVERIGGILHHNVIADPVLQRGGRSRVNVVLRGVVRKNAALLDSN